MTVIVGVDSSEASKAALRLDAKEARWPQASLVAVSAYELPLGPVGGLLLRRARPRAATVPAAKKTQITAPATA
jgi:nucleotide-binding universal stress UspA family protein